MSRWILVSTWTLVSAVALNFTLSGAGSTAIEKAPERVVMGLKVRVNTLNPFAIESLETFQVLSHVLEPLATVDPKNEELRPWLAESWELRPKEKAFRVRIRKDVEFHNGMRMTAEDVKFSLEAFSNPKYKAVLWQGLYSEVASVRILDPHQLEFKLHSWRYQPFVSVMTSLRILPRAFYSGRNFETFRTQLVGTGPFLATGFQAGRSFELKPNSKWWNRTAGLPSFHLVIKPVTDLAMAEQLLNKGDLDFFRVSSSERRSHQLGVGPKFKVIPTDTGLGEGFSIVLNLKKPLFQSRTLREALLRLWDRDALDKKLFDGEFELAVDMISPRLPYYPKGEPIAPDAEKAKHLLLAEGWSDRDQDSVLEKRLEGRTQKLEFEVIVRGREQERWMTLYQSDAARVGVRVGLRRMGVEASFWSLAREGKFEAYANDGGLAAGFFRIVSHSQGAYNLAGIKSPEMDRLLDELEREFDSKRRADLQSQLVLIERKNIYSLPGLYSRREHIWVSSRLLVDPANVERAWSWRLKD
ncbi:MAG: ABC transporter substrate-binding protein [Bdellovibrionales bacterium]